MLSQKKRPFKFDIFLNETKLVDYDRSSAEVIVYQGFLFCSFVLNTFVQYSGVNVPDNLAIEVETILDASSQIPRAFFQHPEGQSRLNTTYELAKNQQRNNSVYVYIPVSLPNMPQSPNKKTGLSVCLLILFIFNLFIPVFLVLAISMDILLLLL